MRAIVGDAMSSDMFELLMKIGGNKMRYTSFLLCFILNGCWYSNGCFYTPQMVNCVDKGKEYPLIAGYQKKELLGHTNSKQRWKDLVSCGGKYGDINLHYYPQNYQINDKRYKNLDQCMNTKGYIYLSPAECGYQDPKWDKGKCNL